MISLDVTMHISRYIFGWEGGFSGINSPIMKNFVFKSKWMFLNTLRKLMLRIYSWPNYVDKSMGIAKGIGVYYL